MRSTEGGRWPFIRDSSESILIIVERSAKRGKKGLTSQRAEGEAAIAVIVVVSSIYRRELALPIIPSFVASDDTPRVTVNNHGGESVLHPL